MEEFEPKVITSAAHPPRIWPRYVNDTFVIQKAVHSKQLLQQLNSIDPHTQFTQETSNTEGSIPFLGTLVWPWPDNTLYTTFYGKSIHTDIHWDRHYKLSAKYSVFNTFSHRVRGMCANP